MGKKFTSRELVQRAEKAWNELWLSLITNADKERAVRIMTGMNVLDGERARLLDKLEQLVKLYRDSTPPFDGGAQIVFRLCKELEQLYIHEKEDSCLEKKQPTVPSAASRRSLPRARPTAASTRRAKNARTATTKMRAH